MDDAQTSDPGRSGQPVQNYVMSKSFPENLLVICNLHKTDTGEWILTKSITQGLPNENQNRNMTDSQAQYEKNVNDCAKFNEINDVLQKLQNHVDSVNCEIKTAKESIEQQKKSCQAAISAFPTSGNINNNCYTNPTRNCGQSSAFNDMPFVDQLFKMFSILWGGNDNDACMCSCPADAAYDPCIGYNDDEIAALATATMGADKTPDDCDIGSRSGMVGKKQTSDEGQSMKENQAVGTDSSISRKSNKNSPSATQSIQTKQSCKDFEEEAEAEDEKDDGDA